MAKYKIANAGVKREDNSFIPNDPQNRDWVEYQEWLAQGNVPDPADVPVIVPKSPLDEISTSKAIEFLLAASKEKGGTKDLTLAEIEAKAIAEKARQ